MKILLGLQTVTISCIKTCFGKVRYNPTEYYSLYGLNTSMIYKGGRGREYGRTPNYVSVCLSPYECVYQTKRD